MDYLTFHLVFTVPVLVALVAVFAVRRPDYPAPWGTLLVVYIAFTYTVGWDSYMIRQNVWWYGDGLVAARLWEIPLGEYIFFVIQTLIVGFWLYLVLTYFDYESPSSWRGRFVLPVVGIVVTGVGFWFTLSQSTFYIGMILVWVGPVLVVQWAYGGHLLVRNARLVALGAVPPALYLASADRYAIERGIWIISDDHTTGIEVLGLPVEEGAFFFLTSLLVVQGVLMFRWTLHYWRAWFEKYGERLPDALRAVHERYDEEMGKGQRGE